MNNLIFNKSTDLFRNPYDFPEGKCPESMKSFVWDLICTFYEAKTVCHKQLSQMNPFSIIKRDRSNMMNWAFRDTALQKYHEKCSYLPYKKFVLHIKGCVIFFHKFGKNGLPTGRQIQNILERKKEELKNYFPTDDTGYLPVLVVGYYDSCVGDFINPQVICMDYDGIKWRMKESDFTDKNPSSNFSLLPPVPERTVYFKPSENDDFNELTK